MTTLTQTIATIVAKNPGITSTRLVEMLPNKINRNSISGTLNQLFESGKVSRKLSLDPRPSGGRQPYRYYPVKPTQSTEPQNIEPTAVTAAPSLDMKLVFHTDTRQIVMTIDEAKAIYATLTEMFA